jgi:Asp/Glu/hydantoin racemase
MDSLVDDNGLFEVHQDAGVQGPYGNTSSAKSILIINPNSNESMTQGLVKMVEDLSKTLPFATRIYFYTGPQPCAYSINNEDDARDTDKIIHEKWFKMEESFFQTPAFDAYLVACYSAHPLVSTLRREYPSRHVSGILEASIWTALSVGSCWPGESNPRFGIVTTGTYWEEVLTSAVRELITSNRPMSRGGQIDTALSRFKGVESTGLNGDELHAADTLVVRKKILSATRRLVRDHDVRTVILGCAGMSGLESIVEEALVEELGEEKAKAVYVVDGVSSGVGLLENLLRTCPRKQEVNKQARIREI